MGVIAQTCVCVLTFNIYEITISLVFVPNVADRKRHAALPHGGHTVMHRLGNNVHVAVFGSILQGN